jgi:DNA-binding IclR family transcriptional regulator
VTHLEKKQNGPKSEYTDLVPAVDQALRILICLAKSPSSKMNLTDICKTVGIHKSKGYSILNTLQKFSIVHKDPEGKTYSLGLGLIALSRKVLDNLNYGAIADPVLKALAKKTSSTALFGAIDDGNVFVVARQEAAQNISVTIRSGYRFSITHGAHGKAIVSFLPDNERDKILKQKKLFFYGDTSKFDRSRLKIDLQQCRETGFAYDIGELNAGINVIASPVFDAHDTLLGSIFIMGTFPESLTHTYGPIVVDSARAFSSTLGADIELTYRGAGKRD